MREKAALSVDELCEDVACGKNRIYDAINSGELKSIKYGRRRMVRPQARDEWLESLERKTTEAMGYEEATQ